MHGHIHDNSYSCVTIVIISSCIQFVFKNDTTFYFHKCVLCVVYCNICLLVI